MADILTGKLSFDKGKWKIVFRDEARQKDVILFVQKNVFAADFNPQEDAETEVDFERDATPQKNATRVRAKGEQWREKRESVKNRPLGSSQMKPGDFHNPYNFIAAPPRPGSGTDLDDAGDEYLAGHDRYSQNRWSGRIAVKLTTRTPLLAVDAARARVDAKDHKTYPARVDSDGRPYIAATSIKGMLRAAYEAVTNSRMGVFAKHGDRLAYRMPAKIGPVPARVERRNGSLGLRIMRAAGLVQIGFAAKLPRYSDGRGLPIDKGEKSQNAALQFPDKSLPEHGEPVWVQVDRSRCTRIERRNAGDIRADWQPGWACITGPNINRKRFERVFLEGPKDEFIPITPKHESLWAELIQNYQETHRRDLDSRQKKGKRPQDYLGDKPAETGWSRHIYTSDDRKLGEGTLCYVELDESNKSEVTGLIPVTISRRLYAVSPDALLPDSLKPARRKEELSPAERVFGWVNQNGHGAYRGNLRIGPIACSSNDAISEFSDGGVPLAILGQPKPQQARFYVADSTQGEAQKHRISREEAGYGAHKGLRGRKVYPHHAGLPEGYWEDPAQDRTQQAVNGFFQEYRRPHKPLQERGVAKLDQTRLGYDLDRAHEQRDDQNRSLMGWVKTDAEFTFNITVSNLSRFELGALLWILELPSDHFHRLGGGKPLGFGSVSLLVDWEKTDLREGQEFKKRYITLDEVLNDDPDAAKAATDHFKAVVARSYGGEFERAEFIAAFRRYAKGFNKPVHYPRTSQPGQQGNGSIPPHPEGKSFEWFVANERTGKSGGPKVALPDLLTDDGLPVLESR